MSPSASTSGSFSDHTVLTEGASERGLKWTHAWRECAYRAWPPPNSHSYPVWKRTHLDQLAMAHFAAAVDSSNVQGTKANLPADVSLPAMWQQLADAKIQTLDIRSQIGRTMARALQARRKRDAADNAFMSAIRPLCVRFPAGKATIDPAHIQDLFERMQESRNDCQFHELSLEKLEIRWKDAQDQLDRLERQLINYQLSTTATEPLRQPPMEQAESMDLSTSSLSQPDLFLGLEIKPDKISHPLYQQLVATFQTLHVARDHRSENFKRKAEIEEQDRRLRLIEKYHPAALQYVEPLRDSDLEFLIHFDVEDNKALSEMKKLSVEVDQLVRLCWDRDILPQDTPLEVVQHWYRPTSCDNLDLSRDLTAGEDTTPSMRFSILLCNPRSLLEDFQVAIESASEQDAVFAEGHPLSETALKDLSIEGLNAVREDKLDYIEDWLLQKLRTSAHEVGMLYYLFLVGNSTNVININDWQRNVLRHWRSDEGTRRKFEELEKAPESSAATRPPSPPSWLSDPVSWYTESSDIEMELDLEMETESKSIGRDEDCRCQDSGSEISLTTTKMV